MAQRPSDCPTLRELYKFHSRERVINILEKIGTKYTELGAFLLKDDDGTLTKCIAHECNNDSKRINKEILSQWLQGKGKRPVTWETLIKALRDIDLTTLAGDIESVLIGTQSQLQQATQNMGGGVSGVGGPQTMHPAALPTYQQQTRQPMGGAAWGAGPQMNPGFIPTGATAHNGIAPQGNQPSIQQQVPHTMGASTRGGVTTHNDTAIVAPPQVQPGLLPSDKVAPDGKGLDERKGFLPYDRRDGQIYPRHNPQLTSGEIIPDPRPKPPSDNVYPMAAFPHGIALIINNTNFKSHATRLGTEQDEKDLIETFRYLGYMVEVYRECTSKEIHHIFEDVRKNRHHDKFDSFVCCILTHGKEDKICGTDSKSVSITALTKELSASNCPGLAHKPKMFFLQACRGLDRTYVKRTGTDGESSTTDYSDFLISYPTTIGTKSFRDLDEGTWFVQELCKTLCKYATFEHVSDMLLRVRREIVKKYEHDGQTQTPADDNRLLSKVYFF